MSRKKLIRGMIKFNCSVFRILYLFYIREILLMPNVSLYNDIIVIQVRIWYQIKDILMSIDIYFSWYYQINVASVSVPFLFICLLHSIEPSFSVRKLMHCNSQHSLISPLIIVCIAAVFFSFYAMTINESIVTGPTTLKVALTVFY